MSTRRPEWDEEGRDWPNREHSRFVRAGWLDWHVQRVGAGPELLLIHGTGSATHSWRGMIGPLSRRFAVTAMDLPGHGFTRGRPRGGMSVHAVARAVHELTEALEAPPALIVAHSAGAAVACQMALEGRSTAPILAFGAALTPFPGPAARIFPAIARLLFVNPFVPSLFARYARQPGEVERFLARSTGSTIDAWGAELYARLFATAEHCAGAIELMADWDLDQLALRLPRITVPLKLLHGDRDATVPLSAARTVPAELEVLAGLGHLAHEEAPAPAAHAVERFAVEHGVLRTADA
ncbi:MAG: alpha/beta fold hydrolase [Sphingomonadaceae bacterium]|nr:alpha/beta fold hydrolase [Sphingomonadaceae bacterium]